MQNPIRVCSLESRRGEEMRSLLERHRANATIAPSMKEVPLADNSPAFAWFGRLKQGDLDFTIFMTGVGTRSLFEILQTQHSKEEIQVATNRAQVVARGPKPVGVLREWKIRIDHVVPEPNTWREIMATLAPIDLNNKVVAIQEYGQPSTELMVALEGRGARVEPVPVYRWEMPDDHEPLKQAVRGCVDGEFDILLITSAQQWRHLLQVADDLHLREDFTCGMAKIMLASIGPTATEAVQMTGFQVDFEPSHPKMGHLVKESLERFAEFLSKRQMP